MGTRLGKGQAHLLPFFPGPLRFGDKRKSKTLLKLNKTVLQLAQMGDGANPLTLFGSASGN